MTDTNPGRPDRLRVRQSERLAGTFHSKLYMGSRLAVMQPETISKQCGSPHEQHPAIGLLKLAKSCIILATRETLPYTYDTKAPVVHSRVTVKRLVRQHAHKHHAKLTPAESPQQSSESNTMAQAVPAVCF